MRTKTNRVVQPEPDETPTRADALTMTTWSEPLRLVDEALARFAHRDLVAGSEVVDCLLDLRSAMVSHAGFVAVVAQEPAI